MAAERGEIPNTLTFSIPGTLKKTSYQLFTGQHLANSGEAQLKKTPCILRILRALPMLPMYTRKG